MIDKRREKKKNVHVNVNNKNNLERILPLKIKCFLKKYDLNS